MGCIPIYKAESNGSCNALTRMSSGQYVKRGDTCLMLGSTTKETLAISGLICKE